MSKKNKGNKGYVVYPPDRPGGQNPQASLISQTQITAQRTVIRALPEPGELKAYREMDPELYEILKREFAANSDHQREMQRAEAADRKTLVEGALGNDKRGMWMSWGSFIISLGVAVGFILADIPIGALIAVLGLLPAIIASFRLHRSKAD